MIAWGIHKSTLCSGCGQPREKAHHPDNDGWYEPTDPVICHACTALARARADDGDAPPAEYFGVIDTRDYAAKPLPPIDGATPPGGDGR